MKENSLLTSFFCHGFWPEANALPRVPSVTMGSLTEATFPYRTIVQLSDLHIAAYEQQLPFGAIQSDLDLFNSEVLSKIDQDVVLITGDLVDAKDEHGGGKQHEEEWAAYRRFEETVDSLVLTVPGNHDRFDSGPSKRDGRVSIHALTKDRRVVRGHDGLGGLDECPVAVLVGIDASTELGLRSPANFLAMNTDEDIRQIMKGMQAVKNIKAASSESCDPTVIAYGHYPMSTFSQAHSLGLGGALRHAVGSIQCLDHPVARHISQTAHVYLCGHLHGLFGRLHTVHTVGGSGGDEAPRRLTELESTAWKDERRFRILAVDEASQCVSFADFYFNTRTSPRLLAGSDLQQRQREGWQDAFENSGWGVTSDGGFSLNGSMALIAWPRDPRYSLCDASAHPEHEVRALVIMPRGGIAITGNASDGDPLDGPTSVSASLSVSAHVRAPDGRALGTVSLALGGLSPKGGTMLFSGTFDEHLIDLLAGETTYLVHVEVRDRAGHVVASSPRQTVSSEPVSLDRNFVEFITLYVNWANFSHRIYLIMHVALLSLLIAQHRSPLLIGYVVYVLVGPLYVGELLSQSGPFGFIAFHHGVIGYVEKQWVWVPTADTLLVATMQLVVCLFPMTAWSWATRGCRSRMGRMAKSVSLLLIVYANVRIVWRKLCMLVGWSSLVLSFGVTWAIPVWLLVERNGAHDKDKVL